MYRRLNGSFPALLVLALVVLVVAACSRVSLLYRHLDLVLSWQVDDYLALTDDQERLMDQRLEALLAWHCSERLPVYVARLTRLEQEPVTYDAVRRRYAWGREEIDRIWAEAAPSMALVLADLSDAQVAGLAEALKEKQRERIEKYVELPLERQIDERAERMRDRAGDWLGSLNPGQRRRIVQWAGLLGDVNAEWVANRARWDAALLDLLATRHAPEFPRRLTHLLQERRSYWTEAFRERFAHNETATLQLLVDLYALADDEQRAYLLRKVNGLRDDLTDLACAAPRRA